MAIPLLLRLCVPVTFLFLCLPSAQPQSHPGDPLVSIAPRSKPVTASQENLLRSDSLLVVIPTHVTTEQGTSVTNLRQENFSITENSIEQTIAHFTQDDAPASIGVLLDVSGSMKTKMKKAAEAAAAFFRTSNPQDEFFLVEFGDSARLSVPFTGDPDELLRHIAQSRPYGRTALLDAVYIGLKQMKNARKRRKALVILSDGGDNWSWHTARQVKRILLETDVQIYAMGIPAEGAGGLSTEERDGPQLLDELAEQSGGHHYPVKHLDEVTTISSLIGTELRNEYLLGYYPDHLPKDGKYHQVSVTLQVPGNPAHLRADHRDGYYAPLQ